MSADASLPVLDDHMHLDPRGKGVEALKDFRRAGGTHAVIVHKPPGGPPPSTEAEHREAMEATIQLAREAGDEAEVQTFVVAAPHPAELTQSLDAGRDLDEASQAYRAGLEAAEDLLAEGETIGLGEVGRPHYEVPDEVWERANELFREALSICASHDGTAVLHTETPDPRTFEQWAGWADEAGLDRERVVSHFAPPIVDEEDNHGLVPSILASEDTLEEALEQGTRFLMETDYLDDPDRPGAVLGPKLVPRRTRQLHERGMLDEQAWRSIHVEMPARVYGIDTRG